MATLSNRTFGVEFEMFFTSKNWNKFLTDHGVSPSQSWFVDTMKVLNNVGLPGWIAEEDGSIRGGETQIEVKTPILQGPSGLKQLTKFCNLFKQYAEVNESTGVHVHVGASDFKQPGSAAERLTMALLHYKNVEDLFDSLTMAHRRGNSAHHARSPYSIGRILAQYKTIITSNKRSLISLINSLQDERYMKINLESLVEHGTIEFRQMHGTLNGELVKNWVIICMSFLDTVIETEQHFTDMLKKIREQKDEFVRDLSPEQERAVINEFTYFLASEIYNKGISRTATDADFKRIISKTASNLPSSMIPSIAQRINEKTTQTQRATKDGIEYFYFLVPVEAFTQLFRSDSIESGMKLALQYFKEDPLNSTFISKSKMLVSEDGIRVLMPKNAALSIAEAAGIKGPISNISKDYTDVINTGKQMMQKSIPSNNVSKLSKQLASSPLYELNSKRK